MIERRSGVPVSRQAQLLGIARASAYYQRKRSHLPASVAVLERVQKLMRLHPYSGARALCAMLAAAGVRIGRDRMLRVMRYLST